MTDTGGSDDEVTLVDPRAPRFGQSITTVGLLAGLVLQQPVFVAAIAVILNVSLASGWRYDLYGYLWRTVMIPAVGPPDEREPAAPHRFAKLMGAVFTGVATILLVADLLVPTATVALGLGVLALAGYGIAAIVAALAGLAAVTDICIGCRLYRQVSLFRELGVV